ELKQLRGELDVAQPAGAELELHVDMLRWDVLRDPRPHPLHRLDEAVAPGARPHEWRDGRLVASAELEVAGDGPRLEQRLELPGMRPAVVVGEVRFEGAHEGAVLALRAQVRV